MIVRITHPDGRLEDRPAERLEIVHDPNYRQVWFKTRYGDDLAPAVMVSVFQP